MSRLVLANYALSAAKLAVRHEKDVRTKAAAREVHLKQVRQLEESLSAVLEKFFRKQLESVASGLRSEKAFCPTGEGGGIDNSCSPNGGSGADHAIVQQGFAQKLVVGDASPEELEAIRSGLEKSLNVAGRQMYVKSVQVVPDGYLHIGGAGYSGGHVFISRPMLDDMKNNDPARVKEELAGTGGERNYGWQAGKNQAECIELAIAHEVGHHIDNYLFLNLGKASTAVGGWEESEAVKVSGYASTHLVEMFAEVHGFMSTGREDLVPEKFQQWYRAALETIDPEPMFVRKAFCPTGPGGGIDNSCSSNGGSGASDRPEVKYGGNTAEHGDGVKEVSEKWFGRMLTDDEWSGISGAPSGSEISTTVYRDRFGKISSIGIDWHNGELGATASRNLKQIEMTVDWASRTTKLVNVISNMGFDVEEGKQGQGIGTQVFYNQVKAAQALGNVQYISTLAEGPPEKNGYYTWPRLGYDADLPYGAKLPAELKGAKTVSDLMATETGRQWWKANGTDIQAYFDPTPGSRSMLALEKYYAGKFGTGKRSKAFCPTGPGGGIDNSCSPGGESQIDLNSEEAQRLIQEMIREHEADPDGTETKHLGVNRVVQDAKERWKYHAPVNVIKQEGRLFERGGVQWKEGGNCVLESGVVTIHSLSAGDSVKAVERITAHELMHGSYQKVFDQYEVDRKALYENVDLLRPDGSVRPEHAKEFPTYSRLFPYIDSYTKLHTDDGVTEYSKAYWRDFGDGRCSMHIAVHETLAEIAAEHETTGIIQGSKFYRDFYKEVRKEYRIQTGQERRRWRHAEGKGYTAAFSNHVMYLDAEFKPTTADKAVMLSEWSNGRHTWAFREKVQDEQTEDRKPARTGRGGRRDFGSGVGRSGEKWSPGVKDAASIARNVFKPAEWKDELIAVAAPVMAVAMVKGVLAQQRLMGIDTSRITKAFCPTGPGGGIDNSCSPNGDDAPKEQPRARAGGEYGPNGEWYRGGAWIATTEMPKMERRKLERAAKDSVQMEPGVRGKPAPGMLAIYESLGPGVGLNPRTMTLDDNGMAYAQWGADQIEQAKTLLQLYKDGEREVPFADYWKFAKYRDFARLAVDQYPIPDEALERMANWRNQTVEELQASLGLAKWKPKKSVAMVKSTASDWLYEMAEDDWEEINDVLDAWLTQFNGSSIKPATELPDWMKTEIRARLAEVFEEPFWTGISETTLTDLEFFLAEGITEGRSMRDIAKTITEELGGEYTRARAMNIARTESGNALNAARVMAAEDLIQTSDELGLPVRMVWMSVLGPTTRDAHADLDGVPADADGMWDLNGVRCRWPSDVVLPPADRCNCQCTVVVEFGMDDAEAAELLAEYEQRVAEREANQKAFCATGPGGGIDNSCGPNDGGRDESLLRPRTDAEIARVREIIKGAENKLAEMIQDNPSISKETRDAHESRMRECFKNVTAPMAMKLDKTVGAIITYDTTAELSASLIGKGNGTLGGAWVWRSVDRTGTLHLDGGKGDAAEEAKAQGVYAHEIGHAIDFRGVHSNTEEWDDAWRDEVLRPEYPLSKYATKNQSEGFAEYMRLVLSGSREAKTDFPKCWKCLKKWGYV